MRAGRASELLTDLTGPLTRRSCLTHVEQRPARPGRQGSFPDWTDPRLLEHLAERGITAPWIHQEQAAQLAHDGTNVVLATATASGKSLAYLLPALTAVGARELEPSARRSTVLYLSPTKALAADQLTNITAMADGAGIRDARVAVYDGDTPTEQRRWVRRHGTIVLTNPDMLHFGILPGHEQWASFFRALRYVVIDECHSYRGVFGSHVAMVMRRLRRIAAHYRAEPTFILASATTATPELSASRLIGQDVTAVTEDGSPRAGLTIGLWEPGTIARVDGRGPMTAGRVDDGGTDLRAGASADTEVVGRGWDGRHASALVRGAVAALGHQRGRRAAGRPRRTGRPDSRLRTLPARGGARLQRRATSAHAEGRAHGAPRLADRARRVAAYRGGYLARERRDLEDYLRSGELKALASTNALELGIDIAGLDAVVIAGWPGTRASLWQQFGRAGRRQDRRRRCAGAVRRTRGSAGHLRRPPSRDRSSVRRSRRRSSIPATPT